MKIVRILVFQVLFLLFFQNSVSSVSFEDGASLVSQGIDFFRKGFYEQSLLSFRSIIGDPNFRSHHGDAHFWTAKCLMVLGRYEDATKSLEYYLLKYKNHLYYSEGLYQKGRLFFLQSEYEISIQPLPVDDCVNSEEDGECDKNVRHSAPGHDPGDKKTKHEEDAHHA